jgi:hypothetical protein
MSVDSLTPNIADGALVVVFIVGDSVAGAALWFRYVLSNRIRRTAVRIV